jgi:hypothetical protein
MIVPSGMVNLLAPACRGGAPGCSVTFVSYSARKPLATPGEAHSEISEPAILPEAPQGPPDVS